MKERLFIFFSFHGLVSIAYGSTRPRSERKAGYIFFFIFHGLVSIHIHTYITIYLITLASSAFAGFHEGRGMKNIYIYMNQISIR